MPHIEVDENLPGIRALMAFCRHFQGEIAALYLHGDFALVEDACNNYHKAAISDKKKSLLSIAASVQKGGKHITPEQIEYARSLGASDRDIHDTVLISAAFCMFNRYVDGLAANTPDDLSTYPPRSKQIIEKGYGNHIFLNKQPVAEPEK
jgi:alkylhydroperoxidase/carboxymuconolactone decarboxylase family protein YurZ